MTRAATAALLAASSLAWQPSTTTLKRKRSVSTNYLIFAFSSPIDNEENQEEDKELLRNMADLESLQEIFGELDGAYFDIDDDDVNEDAWDDEENLAVLIASIAQDAEDSTNESSSEEAAAATRIKSGRHLKTNSLSIHNSIRIQEKAAANLEQALLQGVVPPGSAVGTDALPGDFGFDPLDLASNDYFGRVQNFVLTLIPAKNDNEEQPEYKVPLNRPKALILRDYREAEIRHSRLAMLAAVIWPLQELLDRFFLDEDQFGPLIYGPVTLPYFPLLMTAIMLLLGYLDIYSKSIKDMEKLGDAYLPGDCFWDPLSMLAGAPDTMKRRMQERELLNGRAAMLAVLLYTFEEIMTHKALIEIGGNELLFEPAYQVRLH
jgi:light-harvesting complex I chlorophyll a/b binding protein 1